MTWWRRLFLRLAGVRAPVYAIAPGGIMVVRVPGRLSLNQHASLKASIEAILSHGGEQRGILVLEGGIELVGIINPVGRPWPSPPPPPPPERNTLTTLDDAGALRKTGGAR